MVKEVYNPKAVIPHAASLHQACAHCAIFPTAASRRSLGRVSVPVWPVALSGRLRVVALVGHHPTNKLIGREPIPDRKSFPPPTMPQAVIPGISPGFPGLSQSQRQVAHVLLTRSPLHTPPERDAVARLACVKHAASVRPEPGSNSPTKTLEKNPGKKSPKTAPNQTPKDPVRHRQEPKTIGTGITNTLLSSQRTTPPEATPPHYPARFVASNPGATGLSHSNAPHGCARVASSRVVKRDRQAVRRGLARGT